MMPPDLPLPMGLDTLDLYALLFKWMLACVSCVLAGMAIHGILIAASRRWPALLPRRGVWLAAQCAVAAAALLPLLPQGQRLSVTPAVTLSAKDASALRLAVEDPGAAPPRIDAADGGTRQPANEPSLPTLTVILPSLWTLVYLAGLIFALARMLRARRLWRALLATAQRLTPGQLLTHGAFSDDQLREIAGSRLRVMEIDAAISPALIGVSRPVLLLPRHLRDFSGEQQQMIVAHELQHWRARDPLCLGVSAALQALFWFNPALRWLASRMNWSLELACDQRVLAGRPQQQRKQYAAALLRQWKTQAVALPSGGTAFGGVGEFGELGADTIAARIRHMQQTALPRLTTLAACTVAALITAVLTAGALLQPALAFSVEAQAPVSASVTARASAAIPAQAPAPAPARPTTNPAANAGTTWLPPLEKMRVSGFFGVQREVSVKPHPGIDIAAGKGTPVRAAAAGTVIAAGALAENNGRYGTTVVIDTGSTHTLYAHLNSIAVKPGERVAAGQLIGAVGATGFATGPHLHFEVRRDGHAIDPATRLANLDAHATQHALKTRLAQLGH